MGGSWLARPEIVASTDGGVDAVLEIPSDSPWFAGHFPGRPVLPGVAWLHTAAELVRKHVRRGGRTLEVSGFRNVRFLRSIESGVRASLVVGVPVAGRPNELRFEVRIEGEAVCRGLVAVRAVEGDT